MNHFDKVKSSIQDLNTAISDIDKEEESGNIDEASLKQRTALKADLASLTIDEARRWKQLCKKSWLKDGDENSAFFHKVCTARKRNSFISEISDDFGNVFVVDQQIEEEFIKYFNALYNGPVVQSKMVINLSWHPIDSSSADYLKSTLHQTIAPNQSAFVKGRQITDAILVANEIVDHWTNNNSKGVVIKLDLEKAFDKISWDFILSMLHLKGYSRKWIGWIRACISTANYSIILIGKPRGKINSNRGIRQGDPLSPFLFVIAMDYLSRLLDDAQEKGIIQGYKLSNNKQVTHLLFADDILLFSVYDNVKITGLRYLIKAFELASGLNVNGNKSTISGINLSDPEIDAIVTSWNYKYDPFPISYLGAPLGGNPKNTCFWDPVVEAVNRKFTNWKFSYISKGGRTLVQSVLSNILTYHLSVFKAPASIYQKIEKLMRNFLWEGIDKKGGSHLVRWDIAASPNTHGGLGINRLCDTNIALLCKWLWRYITEDQSLWKLVINTKYNKEDYSLFPSLYKGPKSKALWPHIVKTSSTFSHYIHKKIRNGISTSFWHENWTGLGINRLQFPRFYTLSYKKECFVAEAWDQINHQWNVFPRRPMLDRESVAWRYIYASWPSPTVNSGNDLWFWTFGTANVFTVKSIKEILTVERHIQPDNQMRRMWETAISKKCKFFIWSLKHQGINTVDKMQARRPNMDQSQLVCSLQKGK